MKNSVCLIIVCGLLVAGGCTFDLAEKNVIVAKYTVKPIELDGKLDDAAWQEAAVYQMYLSKDKLKEGQKLQENAKVSVTWNDEYFYLGVNFTESDIIAEGETDQIHHYKFGDLCELFLKPAERDNYLELYVTPRGKKTSFRIPDQKNGWPSSVDDYQCGLEVAAHIENGTLNMHDDKDNGWTAEMAIPLEEIEKLGEKFAPGRNWRILVARYNYSKSIDTDPEYSMTPSLSRTSFHLIDEYAQLELEK